MNPKSTRLVIFAVIAVVAIAAIALLNRPRPKSVQQGKESSAALPDDSPTKRRGSFNGFGVSGSDSGKGKKTAEGPVAQKKNHGTSLTAAADEGGSSTQDVSNEEALSREYKRYMDAQEHAYKFRQLDPAKIKPVKLENALKEASDKYKVPKEILTAMMIAESGGTHRDGDHSIEGGYGVMNLKENNIIDTAAEAAQLIGVSKEDILQDQKLNIMGAAALLQKYHDDAAASGLADSEAWYTAVSQYSGRPNPELAAALADETAGVLIHGFTADLQDGGGPVTLPPNPNPPFWPKNFALAGVTPKPGEVTPTPIAATPGTGSDPANQPDTPSGKGAAMANQTPATGAATPASPTPAVSGAIAK